MPNRLRLAVTAALLSAAVLGGVALQAPAANAQSSASSVTKSWRSWPVSPMIFGKTWYSVIVKRTSDTVVTLSNGEHAYKSYRVKVVNEDTGKVRYSQELSPIRARYAYEAFTSIPTYITKGLTPPKYNAEALKQAGYMIEHDSIARLSKELFAFYDARKAEKPAFEDVPYFLADFTGFWYPSPPPASFAAYTGSTDYGKHGFRRTVTIKSANEAVLKIYVNDKDWIGARVSLTKKYPMTSDAIASSTSASGSSFILWVYRNFRS